MDQSTFSLSLSRQAIDAALKCDWEAAVTLNEQLIKEDPNDITSLNRLARAFCELGKYPEAKKLYNQVLELDPYNVIAAKNLKKVATIKKNGTGNYVSHYQPLSLSLFLQEPGITKVVTLTKIAEPQKLSTLSCGALVNLVPKIKSIVITDFENSYLGVIPDDVSHMLLRLINGGNKYQAIIKSIKPNGLTILIRESYRAKKFKNQPSFLDESNTTVSMSSDNLMLNSDLADDQPMDDIEDSANN